VQLLAEVQLTAFQDFPLLDGHEPESGDPSWSAHAVPFQDSANSSAAV
jgi:hypothetical protein